MSISAGDELDQIEHMIAFIHQEANEKAEEIEVKAEEEFNIEKARLGQKQRQQVIEHYQRKEKQLERQKKIQASNVLCQARLRILRVREDLVSSVLDEVRRRLGEITRDRARYKVLLEKLILEALYHIMESNVILRCRQVDQSLVQEVISTCADQYKTNIGDEVSIVVDTGNYLPAKNCGGIEMIALDGRVKVPNTLESRFELISKKLIPDIRNAMFGLNPNRKFTN